MSDKIAELQNLVSIDDKAAWVSHLWDQYNNQRREKIEEWKELRDYLFATDTSSTGNGSLPWKNSTTLPKLTQIRDNLHANYISALFPNDNWLQWQGYTLDDSLKAKAEAIEAYMGNKTRINGFRTEVSKLLYDFIDYGNAFAFPSFENRTKELPDGTEVTAYVGPVAHRVSPLDIVFNPLADRIDNTYKIIRSTKTLGEIRKLAETEPDNHFWSDALKKRQEIVSKAGAYSIEDFDKALGFQVDGFGNMHEYFQSGYMEILEFFGDYHDAATGELTTDRVITIVDRSTLVRDDVMPQMYGGSPFVHAGWRARPDNLWHMGPLDNLVGLQYRLDHLENLKADAMDLCIHPPLKIIGEVEEFAWGPGAEIHIDEGGDVVELGKNLNNVMAANNELQIIEDRMELYAGAPREAMGVRSPGEKTAFEVQELATAAGRIFQEKITHFERELLEPLLNKMLETAQRNMTGNDVIRVMDNDIGAEIFSSVTAEDIIANGKIRPVGARHFAKQAQDLQNLNGVLNGAVGEMVAPHMSAINLTKFIDDVVGLKAYEIFSPNAAVAEQQETQTQVDSAEEEIMMQRETEMPV